MITLNRQILTGTLPKENTHKTPIIHHGCHMNVLCKSVPSRVPTTMFTYNKQINEINDTNITKACSKTTNAPHPTRHPLLGKICSKPNDLLVKSNNWFPQNTSPHERHLRADHNNYIDCIFRNSTVMTC